MVYLGINLKDSDKSKEWIDYINDNLKNDNFIKAPLKGLIKRLDRETIFIYFNIFYPDVSYFGIILLIMILILTNFMLTYWLIFPAFFIATKFFRTPLFFYLMAKRSLKKYGIDDPIKLIKSDDIIKRLIAGKWANMK